MKNLSRYLKSLIDKIECACVNFVLTTDSRLSDDRTPTVHGDSKHSETYSKPTDVMLIKQKTNSHTLVLADLGYLIEMDKATATVVTFPVDTLPVGFYCSIVQKGVGSVTINKAVGVTLHSKNDKVIINGKNVGVTLVERATNEVYINGDLV